ncbi:MAG: metallophosphoesterase [Ruminococcaceae bacterium]|nr:metallophosphoesterase [Oscillospiraceae bacterium]
MKVKKFFIKQKLIRFLCAVVGLVFFAVLLYAELDRSQYDLGVTSYTVQDEKITAPIKVALIADLHNHEYGEDNSELLRIIRDSEPDIIAVVGDIVYKRSDNTSVMKQFFADLKDIAPTCCCLGNHELALMNRGIDVKEIMKETGVAVLDNETVFTEINGNAIAIGGLTYNPDYGTPSLEYLEEFASIDAYKMLLCHYPEYQWQFMKQDIDIAMCGHLHGGLIRIPNLGGLFAPTQGFFPDYTEGVHDFDGKKMVISRGLGSSSFIPRVNNPAEMVFVNIVGDIL